MKKLILTLAIALSTVGGFAVVANRDGGDPPPSNCCGGDPMGACPPACDRR